MAVTPRSLFTADKNIFIHSIEEAVFPRQTTIPMFDVERLHHDITPVADDEALSESEILAMSLDEELHKVIVFDGMAVLQSMKKNPSMETILNLAE